ncbi:26240_t:CDS:1, partial [Gigaspora rosea]
MYWVLLNWLMKVHNYEVTGQWYLEDIYENGDWHYLYCDLSIKKPDNSNPLALLELVATTFISKLKNISI